MKPGSHILSVVLFPEYPYNFMPMCAYSDFPLDVKPLPTLFYPAGVLILQGLAHRHLLCEAFPDSWKQRKSLPPLSTWTFSHSTAIVI